jgi:hypothetical protein
VGAKEEYVGGDCIRGGMALAHRTDNLGVLHDLHVETERNISPAPLKERQDHPRKKVHPCHRTGGSNRELVH